jgi:hypothetical protein
LFLGSNVRPTENWTYPHIAVFRYAAFRERRV